MSADAANAPAASPRRRSQARRLATQALYQWQLTGDSGEDIVQQFVQQDDFGKADAEYFDELVKQAISNESELIEVVAKHFDRPLAQLDPVERAVLLIGVYELKFRIDIPYRVVLNEAVEQARRFGAAESHKYINAILDKAAANLRSTEVGAARRR